MGNTKTVLGFVAGAAAGALAAILFAPDKGSETRKKITGKAGDLTESLKSSFNDFIENIKGAYTDTQEEAWKLEEKANAKVNTMKADAKASIAEAKANFS